MKGLKSACCISLALITLLSAAGCKKKPAGENSSSVDVEYEYVYQRKDGKTDSDTSSDGKTSSAAGSSSASSGKSNNTKALSAYKEKAKKYRGTTVRFATWKDPELNEDGPVVKAFEKEYGIKVKVDLIGQTEYAFEIAGLIAADNAPDIYFSNNDWPHALSCLQPLDAAEIDYNDSIWDQGMFKTSKVNNKTYLLNSVGNIWNEVDCVFYNKRLLKEKGITTPEEYYKNGKWNFDTMTRVMRDVAALGPDYIGGYIDWETALGVTGSSYYKWENGKFSNGINDTLKDVSVYLSTCLKEGLIKGIGDVNRRDDFIKGKTGIAVTNAFGLKKTGYWAKMNADDIGYTYLPSFSASVPAVTTGLFRGWGIIKGAKNPVAAGIFLRYYLDVNNYDLSSAFLNSDAESFFFKLTSAGAQNKKFVSPTIGCCRALGIGSGTLSGLAVNSPDQVRSKIDAMNNTINSQVKELNDYISKYTK